LGRFDFSWDGKNPPKLLEYNADTPSLLLESAKLQKDWFNSVHRNGGKTQSNYLEPALIYALKEIVTFCKGYGSSLSIGLLVVDDDDESLAQMLYIKKLLGYATGNNVIENIKEMWVTYSTRVALQNTGCLPVWRLFDKEVRCLINQYPKEWLINEIESDELLKYDFQQLLSIEPWWKIILGNKALLPMLWSMYPGHPNLLPAYFDDPSSIDTKGAMDGNKWVSKPLYGREGIGILHSKNYTSFKGFS